MTEPCALCALNINRIKMKRQHIHYVDRRIIVCTEGLQPMSDPLKPRSQDREHESSVLVF